MEVEDEFDAPAWRQELPQVLGVLVAHRGSRWLPSVLESFTALQHQPDMWIAVHDGSDPDTAVLLEQHFAREQILVTERGLGFGAKVAAALETAPAADWYWLLHDDAIVEPDALSGLLDVATAESDIGAVGPKVREWPSLRRLVEVGLTMTGTGHRELGLEPGEPDAGQFDRPRDVLAVGTAGMLVRADAWSDIGGLDPELPLFGDDVDFGWRLTSAGWRVRTAPGAVVFHAEATRTSRRDRSDGIPHRPGRRRAADLYVMLANTEPRRFLFVAVRLLLGSLLRFAGYLIGKDMPAARREITATWSVYRSVGRIRRARAARAATRRRPAAETRALLAPFWLPYQQGMDALRSAIFAVVRPEETSLQGLRVLSDDAENPHELVIEEGPIGWRRWPWLATVSALALCAVIAARSLWFGGLSSPVLPPAPDTVTAWWSLILERSHAVGLGSTGWPTAVAVPLAVVTLPFWFSPDLPVWLVMVFAVPLAALTAHRFGRLLTDDRLPRMIWAVTHGVLVATTGALAGGRIGTVVALILLPVIASTLWHLVEHPTWHRMMQAALAIAIAAAFAPIMWWIVLAAVLGLSIRWRSVARPLTIALLSASVLVGPSMISRVFAGWRVWWEAGMPVGADPSAVQVALGLGGGPGQAPWWFAVPLIVLAVMALLPRETRAAVTGAWIVALVGLTLGVIASLVAFAPFTHAPGLPAWAGLPAALWLTGLSTAVLFAAPLVRMRRYRRWARPGLVVALIFPVLSLGWLIVRGVDDPLTTEQPRPVPAYVAQMQVTTLVVSGDIEDGIVAQVVSGSGRILGAEGMQPSADRQDRLQTALENVLSNPTAQDTEELARLGVRVVYAPQVDDSVERRLDAVPGLVTAGSESPTSRVWMVDVDVEPEAVPKAGALRTVGGAAWLLAWGVVVAVALPVRQRKQEDE